MHCPLEDWFPWFNKGLRLWDGNIMAHFTLQRTDILGHIATHSSCFFVSRRKNIKTFVHGKVSTWFPVLLIHITNKLHMLTYPVVNQHHNVMPEISISATPFQQPFSHCPGDRLCQADLESNPNFVSKPLEVLVLVKHSTPEDSPAPPSLKTAIDFLQR